MDEFQCKRKKTIFEGRITTLTFPFLNHALKNTKKNTTATQNAIVSLVSNPQRGGPRQHTCAWAPFHYILSTRKAVWLEKKYQEMSQKEQRKNCDNTKRTAPGESIVVNVKILINIQQGNEWKDSIIHGQIPPGQEAKCFLEDGACANLDLSFFWHSHTLYGGGGRCDIERKEGKRQRRWGQGHNYWM